MTLCVEEFEDNISEMTSCLALGNRVPQFVEFEKIVVEYKLLGGGDKVRNVVSLFFCCLLLGQLVVHLCVVSSVDSHASDFKYRLACCTSFFFRLFLHLLVFLSFLFDYDHHQMMIVVCMF